MLKLALRNLGQKKSRSLLASLTIAVTAMSLTLFLGLSNGIKNATFAEIEKASPLTQISVHPDIEKRGVISFLTQSEKGILNQETVENISRIDGVENVYPELQFNNFASVEGEVFGLSLVTDTMVFGIEKNFLKNELGDPDIWQKEKEPYPAIIPRKLLDIYNFTIAAQQNIPALSEKSLLGKELTLYPNYSTLFPLASNRKDQIKLKVVGFSDKVNLVGITLPFEIVQNLNEKYTNLKKTTYPEIFVETESAEITSKVAEKIEGLGYSTQYFQKDIREVEGKLNYLNTALGLISAIIILTSAIAIISIFLSITIERRKEIGLLRALGARKSHIKTWILLEAAIIGFTGSIIGIVFGIIGSKIIDHFGLQQLANTTFAPDSLFAITATLLLFIIILSIFLSLISAYIPASKAAKTSPIDALTK